MAAQPSNIVWALDVSVSFGKLGGLYLRQERFNTATGAFKQSLSIDVKFVRLEPDNVTARRSLWVSLMQLGDVFDKLENPTKTLAHCTQGLEIARSLATLDNSNLARISDLGVTLDRLVGVQGSDA